MAPPQFVRSPAHDPAAPPTASPPAAPGVIIAQPVQRSCLSISVEMGRHEEMAAATSASHSLPAGLSFPDPHAQLHDDHATGSGELPAKGSSPLPLGRPPCQGLLGALTIAKVLVDQDHLKV